MSGDHRALPCARLFRFSERILQDVASPGGKIVISVLLTLGVLVVFCMGAKQVEHPLEICLAILGWNLRPDRKPGGVIDKGLDAFVNWSGKLKGG